MVTWQFISRFTRRVARGQEGDLWLSLLSLIVHCAFFVSFFSFFLSLSSSTANPKPYIQPVCTWSAEASALKFDGSLPFLFFFLFFLLPRYSRSWVYPTCHM